MVLHVRNEIDHVSGVDDDDFSGINKETRLLVSFNNSAMGAEYFKPFVHSSKSFLPFRMSFTYNKMTRVFKYDANIFNCLLYTSPSPRD